MLLLEVLKEYDFNFHMNQIITFRCPKCILKCYQGVKGRI